MNKESKMPSLRDKILEPAPKTKETKKEEKVVASNKKPKGK